MKRIYDVRSNRKKEIYQNFKNSSSKSKLGYLSKMLLTYWRKHKKLICIGGTMYIVFIIFIGWYFVWRYQKKAAKALLKSKII